MKFREGFISNSSSSSFIIGCDGKLTETKLFKAFGVSKDSIFYNISKDMTKWIIQVAEKMTKEEYMKDRYIDSLDDAEDGVKEIFDKKMTLYVGAASDQDGRDELAEFLLCGLELNYISNDLIIKKDAWY